MARLVDATLIGGLWLASFWLRFHVPLIEVTKGFPTFSTYAALTPLVVVLWAVILTMQGVYRPQGSPRRLAEIAVLFKAHLSAILCFVALTYVFSEYRYSRGVILYFGVLGALALVADRMAVRAIFRGLLRRGYRTRKVLLVGEGRPLELLVGRITRFPELGLHISGVLLPAGSAATDVAGRPVLGHFGDVGRALRDTGAHKVLIALARQQWAELEKILEEIKDETVDIQVVVPDLHEYAILGSAVEDFDGLPIVSLNESPLLGWRAAVKRATDVLLAGVALLIGAPVFLIIAATVKLTSRGPIFYAQERMGLDGRTFKMYKFRSMRIDAEAATGAVWAKAGDDRRTPIGGFLRATSLDEIPQFWNVLVGNMSLVGPRPERPVFVNQFRHQISHYMLRHRVKAGVTGWAQVNGWRGNTSLDQRILCDLYYIRNWSYLFDLKILLLTVWKGFVNRNAY
ncbi:MAG TPA: undecaprenyl-phosphate glucose phosphotransferase [Polyangia bacterium]|nr:undecaprenyl-phosphate glucose phosphotransferase [Polyangia bacterium]